MHQARSYKIILESLEAKIVFPFEVAMEIHQAMLEDTSFDNQHEDDIEEGGGEALDGVTDTDVGPKGPTLNNNLSLSDAALFELINKVRSDPNFNPKHLNLRNLKLSLQGMQILSKALPELGNVESISLSSFNAKMPLGKKLSHRMEKQREDKEEKLPEQHLSSPYTSPFAIKPPKPK